MRHSTPKTPVLAALLALVVGAAPALSAGEPPGAGKSLKGKNERVKTPGGAKAEARDPSALVEAEVARVVPRPGGGMLLLLQEKTESRRVVPMVIGENEGRAILMRTQGDSFPRPLTHDLLESVLEALGARVVKLEISGLADGTFIGTLHLEVRRKKKIELDVRPSDGTVLAVGAGSRIYISEWIVEQVGEPAASWGLP